MKDGASCIRDISNKNNTPSEHRRSSQRSSTTTDSEPEVKLEDFVNEAAANVVQDDSPQSTTVDDSTNLKLLEANAIIDKLQDENNALVSQFQVQMIIDEQNNVEHGKELEALRKKMEKLEIERKIADGERRKLQEEDKKRKQIKSTIRTINYEKNSITISGKFPITKS